jgi:hypothetical protein
MLKPLKQWICDTCGEVIQQPDHGWLDWLVAEAGEGYSFSGFRIIHHRPRSPRPAGCYQYERRIGLQGIHLDWVYSAEVGKGWIIHLVEYASNPKESAELLRRLTIPYYEEARQNWTLAVAGGMLENGAGDYHPDNLKDIIKLHEVARNA